MKIENITQAKVLFVRKEVLEYKLNRTKAENAFIPHSVVFKNSLNMPILSLDDDDAKDHAAQVLIEELYEYATQMYQKALDNINKEIESL